MPDKYARLITRALQTPWAITPEMAAVVWDLLRFRASGGRLTVEEVRARIGDDDQPRPQARDAGAVAVIPVFGVLAHRTFEASSGMTSAESISRLFARAVAAEDISSILLDVSSPGGTVEGIPELGETIFAARAVKPVVAISNALMASAAYWLGSQASELVVIPSGEVGSIGVYSLHEDWTGWLEKEGIKITAIKFGDRKIEGAPWEPLDDEALAHFKARVDAIGRQFVSVVARGRGVRTEVVRETFGQGRVFDAKQAKRLGMVDRIATFDETLERLIARPPRRSRSAGAHAGAVETVPPAPTMDQTGARPTTPHPASTGEPTERVGGTIPVVRQDPADDVTDQAPLAITLDTKHAHDQAEDEDARRRRLRLLEAS